jgi:hypothetical protein
MAEVEAGGGSLMVSFRSAGPHRGFLRGGFARARVAFKAARFGASRLPAPRRQGGAPAGQLLNATLIRAGEEAPRSRNRAASGFNNERNIP